jgi:glycosyltransferase involved in cell wall biosynthesis
MEKAIRVLHCPTSVGGNPQALARAERELGLQSVAVSFEESYIDYKTDEQLYAADQVQLKKDLRHWQLLWRIVRGFDVVHYNFGKTILTWYYPPIKYVGSKHPRILYEAYDRYRRFQDMLDLPLLKKLGKKLVVTYQGDDARQGDFCRANFPISPATEVEPEYYSADSDAQKRHWIARFDQYADRIYALNPDLLHVLPERAQFLPYANIDPRDWQPVVKGDERRRLTVVHAPTHRGVKGTPHILEAVRRLQAEAAVDFEFVLIEGLSHAEARRLYERADLLIDQLLCGWYGGLAVEFMALGKPVVCYLRQDDLKFIPAAMRDDIPIINATPTTIYEVLKEWLTVRSGELSERGKRSRQYVESWHDPLKIAARLKTDYQEMLKSN